MELRFRFGMSGVNEETGREVGMGRDLEFDILRQCFESAPAILLLQHSVQHKVRRIKCSFRNCKVKRDCQ